MTDETNPTADALARIRAAFLDGLANAPAAAAREAAQRNRQRPFRQRRERHPNWEPPKGSDAGKRA